MFKETSIEPGSDGSTESSERLRERYKDSPKVLEFRAEMERKRRLPPGERAAEIRHALDAHDLETARLLVRTTETERPKWERFVYDEYMRRGEFLRAALLAKSKRQNFTEADVRRAAVLAYRAAKENPLPIKRMKPPPVLFEGYVRNDYQTSDAELIKREFGLTDEDVGPSLPKAA